MSTSQKNWSLKFLPTPLAAFAVAVIALPSTAAETAPPGSAAVPTIEAAPISCWWKTDKTAVHVGERFTLELTCSVVETSRVTAVPNFDQLDPGALLLSPFEVVGGTRHEDIQAGIWRYFQYEYTLRLIEDNYFRQDVDIPALSLTYSLQMSSGSGASAQQGRDHTYSLPALPVRINSLVPRNAAGIRDARSDTFADIETRAFRARSELAAAAVLFSFAAVLFLVGFGKSIARVRRRLPVAPMHLTPGALIRACAREASRLGEGQWTPESASRALAIFRIAGAVALSRPVAQVEATKGAAAHEGQLMLRKSWFSTQRLLVSAPTTERALSGRLASSNGKPLSAANREVLEGIQQALAIFGTASYARDISLDPAALDPASRKGRTALRQLRLFTLWPVRTSRTLLKRSSPLEDMAWSS